MLWQDIAARAALAALRLVVVPALGALIALLLDVGLLDGAIGLAVLEALGR